MIDTLKIKEEKMPLWRKVSYSFPDTGGQLIMTTVGAYVLFFFTDVAKINIGQAGNLMLIAKIVAAVAAPIAGILIDRTRSKFGKARPWYLWMCVPYAVFGILSFVVPNFSAGMNMVYMWGTYILLNAVFVFINTPTTAILPLLTDDPDERVQLTSFRNGISQFGTLIANACALPLVAFLGNGDDKKGFFLMMVVMASVCTLFMLGAFGGLKEMVRPNAQEEAKKPKKTIKEQVGGLKGNVPFALIIIVTLLLFIAITIRNTSVIYYFTYNLGNKNMTSVVNGLNSTQFFTIVLIPFFAKRFGNINTWVLGIIMTIVAQIGLQLSGDHMTMVLVMWVVSNLGFGFTIPMCFTMLAETADFAEWKTGIACSGLIAGLGATTMVKLGGGLGGAVPAWIMNATGYQADVSQTARALTGISITFIWLPVAVLAFCIIPLIFYKKYEKMGPKIRAELAERRAQR